MSTSKKKRKKARSGGKGLLIGLGVGGAALLIAILVTGIVVMTRPRQSRDAKDDGKKEPGQSDHANVAALTRKGAKFFPDPKAAAARPRGVLVMVGPEFTDEHLALVAPLTNLTRVTVKGSSVTDDGLVHLKNLTELESLGLSNTNINGKGFTHLKGLPRLSSLEIDGTKVSDATIMELRHFKALKNVEIQRTKLSESTIAELRKSMTGVSFFGPPPYFAFSSPEGRFKVVFPWQAPKANVRKMPTPAGPVRDTAFLVEYGSYSASVTFADFDTAALKDADLDTIINAGRDAIASQHSATISKDQKIMVQGHTGREIVMTFPGRENQGPAAFRWYIVGRRLYTLAILADGGSVEQEVTDRFFSSFTLTK